MSRWLKGALGSLLALAAMVGPVGATSAATYPVSGKQTVVDEAAGTYRMSGGLIGDWETVSFKETGTSPYFEAKGKERFKGCLDANRDGKCGGDPSGTLSFKFIYWGEFGPGDSLVWGSCWHPITKGTGGFAGAQGVLTMVDTPSGGDVSTAYVGNVTIGGAARTSAAVPRGHCG